MLDESELLKNIEAFCKRHDMPVTEFGIRAFNNPNFVGDLRRGLSPRMKTASRAVVFMKTFTQEKKNAAN